MTGRLAGTSGDEIVRLLVHDALVKGLILVGAVVVLIVAAAVVWRLLGRPERHDRRPPPRS
ncbi:hypothetical protein LEP48_17830 [Isoptericola sp. NEAU-Y5]|uniref:Uncharacterized protein n=1 Tax=Isoptericola luteus TaxID=2879484 RepID=A0ABS7ZL20_9MICO|nr:hypothetical protein [Isoptericola sp. NEAU-Y5]MCA5895192.1 hypothetical protein [Isoptericola sp. NEAU-Y5]